VDASSEDAWVPVSMGHPRSEEKGKLSVLVLHPSATPGRADSSRGDAPPGGPEGPESPSGRSARLDRPKGSLPGSHASETRGMARASLELGDGPGGRDDGHALPGGLAADGAMSSVSRSLLERERASPEGGVRATPASCPVSEEADGSSLRVGQTGPEVRNGPVESGGSSPVWLDVDVPARSHTHYACLQLIDLATGELPRTWMHDGQKNQLDLHRPLGKYLASVAISGSMYVSVNLDEKVLQGDHICESQGSDVRGTSARNWRIHK
jgi:hypothetical protein